jgi:mannose-P-dolichol utilization defect 1
MILTLFQNILVYIASFGWPEYIVGQIIQDNNCANILFRYNFLDKKCLSLSISKSLGYITILGSCFYKLPVLLKIVKAKGGDGLNIISVYMETSSYLALLFYNIFRKCPFTTYGDLCATTLQNFMIIGCIWLWGIDKKPFSVTHILAMICLLGLFVGTVFALPVQYHHLIIAYSISLTTLSRLPQIISNFKHGKVGVQSPITLVNSVLGAVAKVFITFVETKDIFLIIGSVMALVLNSILFGQIIYLQSGQSHHESVDKTPPTPVLPKKSAPRKTPQKSAQKKTQAEVIVTSTIAKATPVAKPTSSHGKKIISQPPPSIEPKAGNSGKKSTNTSATAAPTGTRKATPKKSRPSLIPMATPANASLSKSAVAPTPMTLRKRKSV